MKLYNPFKWHIRKVGSKYAIAKRGVLFWYYYDIKDGYLWSNATSYWMSYCLINSIEESRVILKQAKQQGCVEQ